ncbi:diguanylate cyclase/phosphodiesterase [Sphingomonas gellani]|uniref:Diguanylate cyclase/phosphodiesterase n=1 Tax=Sphingomonas gellani TaxID=1166340 RepID=A0A1H8EYU2_9SPHN|nr:bifunctional diguanylate cyclase/phosphodiesterase [Sphingomonas gellani]SEN24635.1 diguanylate cyclase/phosphodiesterase [Sphingomonas gellani]
MGLLASILFQPAAPDPIEAGLQLVSVPAAHVVRVGEGFRLDDVNAAFRQARLGEGETSPFLVASAAQIDAFLRSDEVRRDFEWEQGESFERRHYRVTIARASAADANRCVVTLLDQTSQHQTERSLRREMTTDSLTGLPNREAFSDLIEQAAQDHPHHAVLVVDLSRFGRFNACLGSLAGDELLITVARRLRGALRARDTLARIGGDEFGILMTIDDGPEDAHQVAQRIHRALATPFRLTDYEIGVECSIGIALGTDCAGDVEELIRHAQFAVKRAKATGATETYQPQAFAIAREQFGMETALRRAIEDRQLRLSYQPIHDLVTGHLVGFESLARWTDDDGRAVEPGQFIPVAEESGLIVPLGRWALDEAAQTLAQWDAVTGGHCGARMAVNLSAIQLQRDAVPDAVAEALTAAGISGDRLTLELTESALVTDPDRIAGAMWSLRELGATLALDDFGTGYSNLAYLQKLPIDILKMDRSFVTGMLADRDKIAIVRAVLSLAQALGKRTVAEGIETVELAQTLAAMGCDLGQGYYYGRPLEVEDALALLLLRNDAATTSAS